MTRRFNGSGLRLSTSYLDIPPTSHSYQALLTWENSADEREGREEGVSFSPRLLSAPLPGLWKFFGSLGSQVGNYL